MRASNVSARRAGEASPEPTSILPTPALRQAIQTVDAEFFQIDRGLSHLRCVLEDLTRSVAASADATTATHVKASQACLEALRLDFGRLASAFLVLARELRGGREE